MQTQDTAGSPGPAATPLSRALDTIRALRAQLRAREGTGRTGPVAIVGAGLRLPGGIDDLESYWAALAAGRDLTQPLPESRQGPFAAAWAQLPHTGGFLDEVMDFDAGFFGLTAAEARSLDPQHRLLLEVAWEALENAALPPGRIDGGRTGLFIGITGQEYWGWQAGDADLHWAAGNGHCFAVGRLAYALGLGGPAITVDTACSSSLVTVHLARQALSRRECDLALAGGVNLALSPHGSRLHQLAGTLSQDGRCRPFDARANGLARGEGCGVVVLKRLEDAQRDHDRILAVLHGSAVNQAGRSTGFGAPNVLAEAALIEAALADAGLTPADIGLVEAHGTGTSLGDTIEMEALATALGRKNGGAPLPVGSVKANLGHLEAAAGAAALLKTIVCLRHQAVPPLAHFTTLNPLISLDGTGITLPTALAPWPGEGGRYAAASAFGMGGTNAHVIVGPAEAPLGRPGPDGPDPEGPGAEGFELSAPAPAALRALAARFRDRLAQLPDGEYPAFAYTATSGRARHRWQAQVTAVDRATARRALDALAADEPAAAVTVAERDQWSGPEAVDPGGAGLTALPRVVIDLPNYPWQRRRYAPEAAPAAGQVPPPPAAVATQAAASASQIFQAAAAASVTGQVPPAPAGIREKLLAEHPSRRRALLTRRCAGEAAAVLGLDPAAIDPAAPLASLGLTSVQTLELRAKLEISLQIELPVTVGWQFPTLQALVPYLAERMGVALPGPAGRPADSGGPAGPPPDGPGPDGPDLDGAPSDGAPLDGLGQELSDLSDSAIEALLLAKIDELDEGQPR